MKSAFFGLLAALLLAAVLPAQAAYLGTGGYDAPYFQSDNYQDLTEFTSALVNPALLYRVNQYHIDMGAYRWANDGWGFQEISLFVPIQRNHTVGLTIMNAGLAFDKTEIGNNGDVTTGERVRFGDWWFIGNYGMRMLPWLMLGTNAKFRVQQDFGDDTKLSSWPGFDLGVYVNPIDHYRFGDVGFSLNLQDVVPSTLKWKVVPIDSSKQSQTVTTPVTTRLRLGVRYSALNDNIVGDMELVVDNALSDLWASLITIADSNGEVSADKALEKIGRFGAHVKWMFVPQIWLKAGWNNTNVPYVGFNANIMYPLPEMINYLGVDFNFGYSFLDNLLLTGKTDKSFTIVSKVNLDFGPTREQVLSRQLYDKLILAPMNAYVEAMKLYEAGQYWLAGYAFGKVLSTFPNFHLNDKVTFYMGNCYRFQYMNDISRQMYQDGLEKFPTSEMRAKFLYGLMSLDYREGKYEDALKNHAFIVNLYSESDIRPDADYLAGEIHFARKNFNAADQLFSKIKPQNPSYLYAQYTLAIINIESRPPKFEAAVTNLTKITSDTTQDASKQLLIDAANTKLGHLYYEQVELTKAVAAYKKVSPGSPYGDEALLGMAWSWIKVNQPQVADRVLDQLIGNYSKSALIPEAYLLKGYAAMLGKNYPMAKTLFDQCVALCRGDFVTEDELKLRKSQNDQSSSTFKPTMDEIRKNALRRPTEKTIEDRAVLKDSFDKFDKDNTEFFRFALLAKSHQKFFKRKDEILTDGEYALAKLATLMGTRKSTQQLEKQKDKIDDMDAQIKKLKEQLEKNK